LGSASAPGSKPHPEFSDWHVACDEAPNMKNVEGASLVLGSVARATVGAPSFELFGAFFPAWLLCGFLGVAGAITARVLFVKTGLARAFPYQLAVCTSLGSVTALLVWMGCFL
jgi:hypothetical protein